MGWIAAAIGFLIAIVAVRADRSLDGRTSQAIAAIAIAAAVAFATGQYTFLVDATTRWRELGYREMGTTEDSEGPVEESVAREIRDAIGSGRTWALETPKGRCHEVSYPFFWLAFYLFPAEPDCQDPDVLVLLGIEPSGEATVIASGTSDRFGRSWFVVEGSWRP